ncbi:MAG: pyridoxamine 5'-phosphate oxidase family protein, partial [Candidatus Binatia bacterium]
GAYMGQRERISMTDEEVRSFLRRKTRLVLGTLRGDGAPAADVAPCCYEEGSLWALVPRDSEALANVRRDPRVACTLEEFPSYFEIKGVIVHARASETTGEERARIAQRFTGRSLDGCAILRLPLEHVVSFDFGKMKK